MCMLCVEILKGKMTSREIASAYVEINNPSHEWEILDLLASEGKLEPMQDALIDIAGEYEDKKNEKRNVRL